MVLFTVYGVPLSQPFRSVVWALLQKKVPFKTKSTVPGTKGSSGTLSTPYLQKTRHRFTTIPLLEIDEKHSIAESPAILTYLCETQKGWDDWYAPTGTLEKADLDSYLHWHHGNTRNLASLVAPFLRPDLNLSFPDAAELEKCITVLRCLDEAWLGGPDDLEYLANNRYSIADILCYGEVSQVTMTHLVDVEPYPNLCRWMERMRNKPFHDEVHAGVAALGTLTGAKSARQIVEAGRTGSAALLSARMSYEDSVEDE